MAKRLQLRRGTTSEHGSFTGAIGEVTVDTDKDTIIIHDGSTAGGGGRCKLELKGQNRAFMQSSTHQSLTLGY